MLLTDEEIAALYEEAFADESGTSDDESNNPNDSSASEGNKESNKNVDTTKAFSTRLREETAKIESKVREETAKLLGYDSYQDMLKKQEAAKLKEEGHDDDSISKIVDKKLATNEKLKRLEEYEEREKREWAKTELTKLTELTGGEITSFKDVPKEVLELWKTVPDLKKAYLAVKGEDLIVQLASKAANGSTKHLKSLSGGNTDPKTRPMTAQERATYKYFNPNVTDEELNKKRVESD